MFRTDQIITATSLIKDFRRISAMLRNDPQALLLIQKKGKHLVLVNAGIYEELLHFRLQAQSPYAINPQYDEEALTQSEEI